MKFSEFLSHADLILSECAIAERLRRRPDVTMHPDLFNTPLVRNSKLRQVLAEIYIEYRNIAKNAALPSLLCAPTWRVDKMRLEKNGFDATLLADAINFMLEIRDNSMDQSSPCVVGALIAPKNDCYDPSKSLSRNESTAFHRYQLEEMWKAEIDVVIAQTFPAVTEAQGIADIMAELGKPCILSFVINRAGCLLDGTPLLTAIDRIDNETAEPPTAYMVNCVYPTFILPSSQPARLFKRLVGIQANSSSKDHSELDGAKELLQDPLEEWGNSMLELNHRYGMKILGGCCGTDNTYLQFLADHHQHKKL